MPDYRLVLASASQPRLRLLQAAGFEPEAIPSDVAEDGVDGLGPEKAAVVLAERKAGAVADRLAGGSAPARGPARGPALDGGRLPTVVVGCDTLLTMDGRPYGKPASAEQAREWCRQQRNRRVDVVTGQCVIELDPSGRRRQVSGANWSGVDVGPMADEEIEAYLATGEALQAAGALTIDGYGAPFIAGLQGDHGTVVGLSLPLLRELLAELGIPITRLWGSPR